MNFSLIPLQVVPDNFNQLDIALALRDQRMLTKSMKASKRTRQILTNALNRRHPAVPLAAQHTNDVPDSEEEHRELASLLQVSTPSKVDNCMLILICNPLTIKL